MHLKHKSVDLYPIAKGRKSTRPADAFIRKAGVEFKVHSPAWVNGASGVFLIANLTEGVAMVTLPDGAVMAGGQPVDVPPQTIAEFRLRPGASGAFSYSVVIKPKGGGLVTAHGNSDPEIIIDPPAS